MVNKDEVATVDSIFQLYLEEESLVAVVQVMRRQGEWRRTWATRAGRVRLGRDHRWWLLF